MIDAVRQAEAVSAEIRLWLPTRDGVLLMVGLVYCSGDRWRAVGGRDGSLLDGS